MLRDNVLASAERGARLVDEAQRIAAEGSRMKACRILVALVALVLGSTACVNEMARGEHTKVVYGLTLAPSGIDPHVDVSAELGIPLSSVYDTLVFRTHEGKFVAGLAESWEISDDGTEYLFRLRHGVKFHDGTDFNAEAVRRSLERIVDPNTRSRKAVLLLGPYDRCEVVDDYTVRIVLREPFAPLLDSLSQVYLAPASPSALDKWGDDYQFHQVGTGPFMMKEYTPGDRLVLERNPDYSWAPETYERQGPAVVDEIEFRFLVEPSVRAMALQSGDVDIVGEIPPQDAGVIEDASDLELLAVPIPGVPLVGFLNSTRPPTDDLLVRQALLYATDRQAIVNTVFGGLSPVAVGPLSHNHQNFAPELESLYEYSPDTAASLLEKAGWQLSGGANGIRTKDGESLQVDAYVMSWGLVPEVAELLQAQWQQVGVDLVINRVTFTAAVAAARDGKHNLIFWSEAGTDGDLLRTFFHSDNVGLRNWSVVSMPELDEMLDAARREGDSESRNELYKRVQATVMEQALILPIRDYVNLNARRQCVQGLRFDSRGWFPLLHDISVNGRCH